MTDQSIGNIAPPSQCSLCGVTVDLDAVRLECVTATFWKSTDGKKTETILEYCDPRVWLVALCRACRVKSYQSWLKKRAIAFGLFIVICILLIIWWGVLLAWGLYISGPTRWRRDELWSLIGGLLGVIGLPFFIWFYIVNKVRLARSGDLQEIPPKRRPQTFVDAGETILERLQTGQGGTVYGGFPLPVLREAPVPRDIPEKFELAAEKPKQKRLVREIKET